MNLYLIDSDHCVDWLRGHPRIRQRFIEVKREWLAVSEITAAEIYFGAVKSSRPEAELEKVERFLNGIFILPLSRPILRRYARVKLDLRRRGEGIEDFDLLIGCTAVEDGRILVTGNRKHLERIPGLYLEQWRETEEEE